jgi:hypothetical protein
MDKKTGGIIGLVAAIMLCGLPGLCGLCLGPLFVLVSFIPESDIDIFGSSDPSSALIAGIVILVVSVIFVVIPGFVWYYAVREKKEEVDPNQFSGQMPGDF